MANLKGKTLFISGASRGIGLAIALRAARDGANIAIAAKTATADPRLPEEIYLRIEVRDGAGNTGTDQLSEPINVQGLTPRGRIRGFRPAVPKTRDVARPQGRQ